MPPPPPPPDSPPPPPGNPDTTAPDMVAGTCWGGQTVCGAEQLVQSIEAAQAGAGYSLPPGSNEPGPESVYNSLTYLYREAYVLGAYIGSGFDSTVTESARQDIGRTWSELSVGSAGIDLVLGGEASTCVPNKKTAVSLGTQIAIAKYAERKTTFPLGYLSQSLVYDFQYANPQFIPSQPEINAHYLTNQITSDEWECYTRAHGNHPTPFMRTVNSLQVRPNTQELIQLWRRGEITYGDAQRRAREVGVLQDSAFTEFTRLTEFIPPYSDIVRMMVRDSADDAVAFQYGYDTNFEQKFTGPLLDWAKAQGISPDVFKYLWRAHWQIPSYTQLTEIAFRFRPDRPEVDQYNQDILAWRLAGMVGPEPPKPLVFTLQDLQRALMINDMAPEFINGLIGISYRVPTRVDLQRSYEMGTLDADGLYHGLRDLGYDEKGARNLVAFYSQKAARAESNAIGVWSIKKTIGAYKKGTITRNQAIDLLKPLIPSVAKIADALNGADLEVSSDILAGEIKRWRRAYFTGSIDRTEALDTLKQLGIDPDRTVNLVEQWDSERLGRYREPTVAILHKWAMTGIISADDMYTRLLRLGYSSDDSNRIVYTAQYDVNKLAMANYEKTMKELAKNFKDSKSIKKSDQLYLESQIKFFQSQQDRIQKELDKLSKALGNPPGN